MNNSNSISSNIFFSTKWKDYELIDFGYSKKLERFGNFTFVRPDSQAIAEPCLDKKIWDLADGIFNSSSDEEKGSWKLSKNVSEFWDVKYNDIKIKTIPTPFRHLGFFPEQSVHWEWCRNIIAKNNSNKIKVLNLFGYSGIASLDAALAGAEVTHVDASKKAINLAFENRNRNSLQELPIRFLVEDAVNFVKREIRRNNKYDAIIARAFGDMSLLMSLTQNLINDKGVWYGMKSKKLMDEDIIKNKNIYKIYDIKVPFLDAERYLIKVSNKYKLSLNQ